MSRAIDPDAGDYDDGMYSTVWGVKLLTFADLVKKRKKRRKKKKKRKVKKCHT